MGLGLDVVLKWVLYLFRSGLLDLLYLSIGLE
jgi:hypothetical protein